MYGVTDISSIFFMPSPSSSMESNDLASIRTDTSLIVLAAESEADCKPMILPIILKLK